MNVEVIVDGLENNPQCFHGPSLRFRRIGMKCKEYYACSASRDHKDCPFYLDVSNHKLKNPSRWIGMRADTLQNIFSKNPYKKYLKILKSFKMEKVFINNMNSKKTIKKMKIAKSANHDQITDDIYNSIAYCCTCEELIEKCDIDSHRNCNIVQNLTRYQLTHPTEIVIPKEDNKTHAQYFFTKDTVKNIVLLLARLNTKRVLCIGVPRIHEYLVNECKHKFNSMLLDIDLKYYNFYSQKQFIWYNMFNNCVLKEDALETLKKFLQFKEITVLMDPPFGGRVEPLAFTINALNKLYCQVNGVHNTKGVEETNKLAVMWIFPYFMEHHIKASLPDFNMFDLKIDYDNHSSFTNVGTKKRKFGSPVRIFTNIPLHRLCLDGVDGYKFCKSCGYWVSRENRHCNECNSCTSKNGRTYVHCRLCSRCVKPSYVHCVICRMCILPDHNCGRTPLGSEPNCFHCKMPGHKKRDCPEAGNKRLKRKKGKRV